MPESRNRKMPHHASLARNQILQAPEIIYDTQTNSLVINKPQQPVRQSIVKNAGTKEIFSETVSLTENDSNKNHFSPMLVRYDEKTFKPSIEEVRTQPHVRNSSALDS